VSRKRWSVVVVVVVVVVVRKEWRIQQKMAFSRPAKTKFDAKLLVQQLHDSYPPWATRSYPIDRP
jgi:hypothetical protein